MAAGATFKTTDLERFRDRFEAKLGEQAKAAKADYREEVAAVLDLSKMRKEHGSIESAIDKWVADISLLEPFGEGNPKPRVVLKDIYCDALRTSRDGKHVFCNVLKRDMLDTVSLNARAFHAGQSPLHEGIRSAANPKSAPGKPIEYAHALGTLNYGVNQRGNKEASFLIEDIYTPPQKVQSHAPIKRAAQRDASDNPIACLENAPAASISR